MCIRDSGYSVGRVSDIRILQDRDNKILVSMDIDKDLIIGINSKATLSSNDFLGSKAIVLSIGDINSPINEGDTIMSEIAGGLSELLEKATPITDNLGVTISRLNDILASLRGSGDMITTPLDNLNNVLTNTNDLIDNNEETITTTLENLNSLTDDLSKKLSDLDFAEYFGEINSMEGISFENIKIIYIGIYWNDWQSLPDKNIFRKQYPDISDKFVLFAGRLATNKGLSDLISAMDLVNQKSVDLVITGADMGLGKQLEKEALEKGVRMHRLGHIDDETYRSVLAAAEMLVLPSEYEAFGIVLLEAAAAETAVIGTNVGGIPEAMSPGNNGLIVEYNDVDNLSKSIATLLDDAKMCKEMGKAGRVWAKNFSWDSILKELEQEYRSIIR